MYIVTEFICTAVIFPFQGKIDHGSLSLKILKTGFVKRGNTEAHAFALEAGRIDTVGHNRT